MHYITKKVQKPTAGTMKKQGYLKFAVQERDIVIVKVLLLRFGSALQIISLEAIFGK